MLTKGADVMVLNDFLLDMKVITHKDHTTQKAFAENAGLARSNFSRLLHENIVLNSFVRMMEINGYDLEIKYVKREKK